MQKHNTELKKKKKFSNFTFVSMNNSFSTIAVKQTVFFYLIIQNY